MSKPAREHAETLRWEMQSWNSLRIATRQKTEISPEPSFSGKSFLACEYVQTATGKRFLSTENHHGDGKIIRARYYSDGKKCAVETFDQTDPSRQDGLFRTKIFGREDFTGQDNSPVPLTYFYAGKTPIADLLEASSADGEVLVAGRPCDIFRIMNVRYPEASVDLEYCLDQKTSIPLKVSCGPNFAKPQWIWKAESIKEMNGYHLVDRSSYSTFMNGVSEPFRKIEHKVESAVFNGPTRDEEFWPVAQPGVVFSGETPAKPRPAAVVKPKVAASTVVAPVRAEPKEGLPLSTAFLGLGAVILVTGGVLMWRRR